MVPSAPTGKKLPLHRPALSVPLHYESFSASEREPMGRSLVRQTTGGDNREMVQRRQIRFPTPDLSWLLKRKWPLVAGVVLLGTIGGFLSGMRVRLDHRTWLEPSPPATRGGEQALDERDSAVTLGRERAAEERNPAAKSQRKRRPAIAVRPRCRRPLCPNSRRDRTHAAARNHDREPERGVCGNGAQPDRAIPGELRLVCLDGVDRVQSGQECRRGKVVAEIPGGKPPLCLGVAWHGKSCGAKGRL